MLRSLGLFLLLAVPAAAQEIDCDNAIDQRSMTICAGLAFDAADKELNEAWQATIADAKDLDEQLQARGGDGRPTHEETWRKSQRAWISYRDANCQAEAFESRGGSMEPMLEQLCLERLTRLRTLELLGEPLRPPSAE